MEKLHEVSFEVLADGTISLEQQYGLEEPCAVWLHPEQLKFIARRVAGMSEATAAQIADLERQLSVLTVGLEELACDSSARGEILNFCHVGSEFIERLDGLLNLAWEFSGGRLSPDDMRRSQQPLPCSQNDQPATAASARQQKAAKRERASQPALDL